MVNLCGIVTLASSGQVSANSNEWWRLVLAVTVSLTLSLTVGLRVPVTCWKFSTWKWSQWPGLNRRPTVYRNRCSTAELHWLPKTCRHLNITNTVWHRNTLPSERLAKTASDVLNIACNTPGKKADSSRFVKANIPHWVKLKPIDTRYSQCMVHDNLVRQFWKPVSARTPPPIARLRDSRRCRW